MEPRNFESLRQEIQNAIQTRMRQLALPQGEDGFTLIDGFFNFPITDIIDGNMRIGGPAVPMIAIVGNTSGRVFFFPLNVLIPPNTN